MTERRPPASYIVTVDDRRDPAAVAQRCGVVPARVLREVLHGFHAVLDAEGLIRVRADPDVLDVSETLDHSAIGHLRRGGPSAGQGRPSGR